MPEQELFHDLVAMVLGGFDTSARAAGGVLYNLGQNPACLKQLQQYLKTELRYNHSVAELLPTLLTQLTAKKYGELDLLSWVVKESMRLTPSVPVSIDYMPVRRGCQIRGVEVPIEASVFLDMGVAQRDAR